MSHDTLSREDQTDAYDYDAEFKSFFGEEKGDVIPYDYDADCKDFYGEGSDQSTMTNEEADHAAFLKFCGGKEYDYDAELAAFLSTEQPTAIEGRDRQQIYDASRHIGRVAGAAALATSMLFNASGESAATLEPAYAVESVSTAASVMNQMDQQAVPQVAAVRSNLPTALMVPQPASPNMFNQAKESYLPPDFFKEDPRPIIHLNMFQGPTMERPTGIVLHHWGTNDHGRSRIETLTNTLKERNLSVQEGVVNNGQGYQPMEEVNMYASHAKSASKNTIGIEIEGGQTPDGKDMTPEAIYTAAKIAFIDMVTYNIPLEGHWDYDKKQWFGVGSHKDVDKYCPGANGKVDVSDYNKDRIFKQIRIFQERKAALDSGETAPAPVPPEPNTTPTPDAHDALAVSINRLPKAPASALVDRRVELPGDPDVNAQLSVLPDTGSWGGSSQVEVVPKPVQRRPALVPESSHTNWMDHLNKEVIHNPDHAKWIELAAQRYGVDPAMIAAQIDQESDFNPAAVSESNAQGIAQFLPETWKEWGVRASNDGQAPDPFNYQDAIMTQARYMKWLFTKVEQAGLHGDRTELALAAYNAGIGTITELGYIPANGQTPDYVTKITDMMPYYTIGTPEATGQRD